MQEKIKMFEDEQVYLFLFVLVRKIKNILIPLPSLVEGSDQRAITDYLYFVGIGN